MRTSVIALIGPPAGVTGRAPGAFKSSAAAGAAAGPVVDGRATRPHTPAALATGGR